MDGQQYCLSHGECSNYSRQGIDLYVFYAGNPLDRPFIQLIQGISYFSYLLRHAFIFGFVLPLDMPNNELRVTANFKLRGGKCKCKVQSKQDGFIFGLTVRCWKPEPNGLLQLLPSRRS